MFNRPFSTTPFSSSPGAGEIMADCEVSAVSAQVLDGEVLPNIFERSTVADALSAFATYKESLAEAGQGADAVSFGWAVLLAETASSADVATAVRQQYASIADTLVATGMASGYWTASLAIAEAALGVSMARLGYDADAASAAAAEDDILTQLTAIADAIQAAAATDALTASLTMVVLAEQTGAGADTPTLQATMFANIAESGSAFVRVRLGADEFTAWAMNPSTKAVVEYRNFPFNSFAEADGEYYGASDLGFYVLDGDDDDGDQIDSWIRSALNSLGTSRYKAIESCYLGLRNDGQMVLKVITTSESREKVEDWYELVDTNPGVMSENSYDIGQGIESRFFAFELHNVDGSDFEIDSMELIPIVLDRRF